MDLYLKRILESVHETTEIGLHLISQKKTMICSVFKTRYTSYFKTSINNRRAFTWSCINIPLRILAIKWTEHLSYPGHQKTQKGNETLYIRSDKSRTSFSLSSSLYCSTNWWSVYLQINIALYMSLFLAFYDAKEL